MGSKTPYRPEIDGLRAVSVIAVLLFHAGLACPGGYVGVDVFFVISGFLITSLIVKELDSNTFSFATFWERRTRRILPASLFVTAVTILFGWLLLTPPELKGLADSAIAHLTFLSNVHFWRQELWGYFDESADLWPLLHMWSLAIEEQFYLFFPILLFSLRRYCKKTQLIILTSLLLLSLALSVWGVVNHTRATFYLLPTRSWELFVGAVLAFLLPTSGNPLSSRMANLCSFLGLASIAVPIFLYDRSTPFPGLAAVPPCLGCAAIIYSNTLTKTIVGTLLSQKPVVFFGLISYSLYLWHWPIFAGYRILYGIQVDIGTAMVLAGLSVLVGWLSYRFIESPFRLRRIGSRRATMFAQATCISLLLLVLSFVIWRSDGLPNRVAESHLTDVESKGVAYYNDLERVIGRGGTDQIDFLLWGDSHAMAMSRAIDEFARRHHLSGRAALRAGTAPLPGVWWMQRSETLKWNDDVRDFIKIHKVRNVILIARWSVYVDGRSELEDLKDNIALSDHFLVHHDSDERTTVNAKKCLFVSLDDLAREMASTGGRIWILKQVPEQIQSRLAERWLRSNLPVGKWICPFNPPPVSMNRHRQRQLNANDILDQIAAKNENVTIIESSSVFFKKGKAASVVHDNHCLYRDDDHLSYSGSKLLFQSVFQQVFRTIQSDRGG